MAKKSRHYYTLLIREDDKWSPEFGDWSRDVVKSEADDLHEGHKAIMRKDMKVIKTDGKQASIEGAVAMLNMQQIVPVSHFPTTLDKIDMTGLLSHVYAEFNGFRYYLGSASHGQIAKIAKQYKNDIAYQAVGVFISHKSDSTIIHGAWNELSRALSSDAGSKLAEIVDQLGKPSSKTDH